MHRRKMRREIERSMAPTIYLWENRKEGSQNDEVDATCLDRQDDSLTRRPANAKSGPKVSIDMRGSGDEAMNETDLLGTIDVRPGVAEEVRQTVSREHHPAGARRRCEDLRIC